MPYQQQRATFFDRAAEMTPHLSVVTLGGAFFVQTTDHNVGRSLFLKEGRGEMGVLAAAAGVLQEVFGEGAVSGRQFVDVGANIGTTTVPALLKEGFETSVSFEPERNNLRTLRMNLALNGVGSRARAVGSAVSNRSGTAELVVLPDQLGKNWIATDPARRDRRGSETEVVEVPTVTLDQMVDEGVIDPERIGLIWMDAQGHEGHVLEGATKLLADGVPIAMELDPGGLRRQGDDTKVALATEHYSHFLDLRTRGQQDLRPMKSLAEYTKTLGRSTRDILILRLTAARAKKLGPLTLREETRGGRSKSTGSRSQPALSKAEILDEMVGDLKRELESEGTEAGAKTGGKAAKVRAREVKQRRGKARAELRAGRKKPAGGD